MDKAEKYTADANKWELGAELGNDEKFAERADEKFTQALDEALDLQMISIRLPKRMIETLKMIAMAHSIGYQPLVRDVLSRFVEHEVKEIVRTTIQRKKQEEQNRLEAQKVESSYQPRKRERKVA
jgi:predicted DNA binding CopG/RHH family protein